jgi:hypothetical protein
MTHRPGGPNGARHCFHRGPEGINRKTERGFRRGWTPVRKARHSSSGLSNAVMATAVCQSAASRQGQLVIAEPVLRRCQAAKSRAKNAR